MSINDPALGFTYFKHLSFPYVPEPDPMPKKLANKVTPIVPYSFPNILLEPLVLYKRSSGGYMVSPTIKVGTDPQAYYYRGRKSATYSTSKRSALLQGKVLFYTLRPKRESGVNFFPFSFRSPDGGLFNYAAGACEWMYHINFPNWDVLPDALISRKLCLVRISEDFKLKLYGTPDDGIFPFDAEVKGLENTMVTDVDSFWKALCTMLAVKDSLRTRAWIKSQCQLAETGDAFYVFINTRFASMEDREDIFGFGIPNDTIKKTVLLDLKPLANSSYNAANLGFNITEDVAQLLAMLGGEAPTKLLSLPATMGPLNSPGADAIAQTLFLPPLRFDQADAFSIAKRLKRPFPVGLLATDEGRLMY